MTGARARRRDRANRITNAATGLVDYRPELAEDPEPRFLRAVLFLVVIGIVFMLGFASGTAYGAEPCIRSFEVRPTTMFRLRQYDIEARIRIEPHPDHRAYALSFTSDVGAEGGSMRELNNVPGQLSEITQDPIWIKGKPGGHYLFVLAVYGAGGKLLERKTAEIKPVGEDDDR